MGSSRCVVTGTQWWRRRRKGEEGGRRAASEVCGEGGKEGRREGGKEGRALPRNAAVAKRPTNIADCSCSSRFYPGTRNYIQL